MMGEFTELENFRGESDHSSWSESQKSLQYETFTNKFGHFKSYKAILADWWNIQKFVICFGHMTAENSTVQELYKANHRCETYM